MKIIIYTIVITIIIPCIFLSQENSWREKNEFNLGQRNYKYLNGNWYKYDNENIKDKIYLHRLLLKKKNGDNVLNTDLKNIGIEEVTKISKKLLGGYYVLSIDNEKDPFTIIE